MDVLVALGNPLRADDNIGNLVANELELGSKFKIFVAETSPENFISKIKDLEPEQLIFIDAVEFNGAPGEVRFFDISELSDFNFSTHGESLSIFKKFFKDVQISLIGIQPKLVDYGEISEELLEKIPDILLEIESFLLGN